MNHVLKFAASFALVALSAALSSYFSYIGVDTFYSALNLPPLNPPNYVFPIVWPILYVLMMISFYIVLNEKDNHSAIFLFVGQLFLHILWCYLFFAKGLFAFGFVDIVLLIWTVFVMIKKFYGLNQASGFLQIPYLLWLLFAAYLNAGVWYLNGSVFAQ